MRIPRASRLEVIGVAAALGLVTAAAAAAPAHADTNTTALCASVTVSQGTGWVDGFLCTYKNAQAMRGTITDGTHAYFCVLLTISELGSEITGWGCTPEA